MSADYPVNDFFSINTGDTDTSLASIRENLDQEYWNLFHQMLKTTQEYTSILSNFFEQHPSEAGRRLMTSDWEVDPVLKETGKMLAECSHYYTEALTMRANAAFGHPRRLVRGPQLEPGIISVLQQGEAGIILHTPVIHKRNQQTYSRNFFFDELARAVISRIDFDQIKAKKFDMYILVIYPPNTGTICIADSDNIDVKPIGDLLANKLKIDDNCINISLHIFGEKTKLIAPGEYWILKPKSSEIYTAEMLIKLVLMASKS